MKTLAVVLEAALMTVAIIASVQAIQYAIKLREEPPRPYCVECREWIR